MGPLGWLKLQLSLAWSKITGKVSGLADSVDGKADANADATANVGVDVTDQGDVKVDAKGACSATGAVGSTLGDVTAGTGDLPQDCAVSLSH